MWQGAQPGRSDNPLEGEFDGEFDDFFRREAPRLFRGLLVITRNRPEAEDLTQEAGTRVWRDWERVRAMSQPAAYMYRTALNLHFMALRRIRRRGRRLLLSREPVEDPMQRVDERDELKRRLLGLPPRERAALVLVEYLNYNSVEAAEILRVRPGTVRTLLARARKRMGGGG